MTKGLRDKRPGGGNVRSAAPCLGVALIVAFMTASLAPCPPTVGVTLAHTQPAPGRHAQPVAADLTAPCPCQCGEHAPIAGGSTHIGVALPSSAPDLAPRLVAKLARFVLVRSEESFAIPIDHIPLPA